MHIAITGDLGSGKSTVAQKLAKELGYEFLSTGAIQRKMAAEKGMNTLEFNHFADNNKEVDDYIDQHLKDIDAGDDPYVLDSRLAWFFVKKSFKVNLLAFDEVAAERIMKDKERTGEPDAKDVAQKIADTKARRISENNRFAKLYGVQFDTFTTFDLVVDTSAATIEEVTDKILDCYKKWKKGEDYAKIWVAPKRVNGAKSNHENSEIESDTIPVSRENDELFCATKEVESIIQPNKKKGLVAVEILP